MTITIDAITKTFDTSSALNGVSLEIEDGSFVALLGPSGSGKTTLLRIIAGLETADAGHILFHGEDVTDRSVQDRKIGFVFQHYALFRHMTVAENIAFGLTVMKGKARPKKAAIAARVQELLDLVQLPDLGKRFPSQLSGGQRQRVALARALAREPDILLLDEPFGALDAKVRRELRVALREIHDRVGLTSIFVTHDREEAFALADKVAILSNGKIEQYDTPKQVEENPATPFVHDFVI
jgi:sulfate transport system ATP-binding protein